MVDCEEIVLEMKMLSYFIQMHLYIYIYHAQLVVDGDVKKDMLNTFPNF